MSSLKEAISDLGSELAEILSEVEEEWLSSKSLHFLKVATFQITISGMRDLVKQHDKWNIKRQMIWILITFDNIKKNKPNFKTLVRTRPHAPLEKKEHFKALALKAKDLYDRLKLRFVVYCKEMLKYAEEHEEDDPCPSS